MPGIMMSSSTRSGGFVSIRRSALWPSRATLSLYSPRSALTRISTLSATSSTIRIRQSESSFIGGVAFAWSLVAAPVFTSTLAFELNRAVRDRELLRDELADVAEDRVAVAVLDVGVGGKRLEAAGDGPDVEVVHADHSRDARDGGFDRADVDVGRRGLHQDVDRIAHQGPRGPHHEQGYQERGERIGPLPAEAPDERARGDRLHAAEGVGGDVKPGAAQVERVVAVAVEEEEGRDVDQQAAGRDPHHRLTGYRGRRREASPGLD